MQQPRVVEMPIQREPVTRDTFVTTEHRAVAAAPSPPSPPSSGRRKDG